MRLSLSVKGANWERVETNVLTASLAADGYMSTPTHTLAAHANGVKDRPISVEWSRRCAATVQLAVVPCSPGQCLIKGSMPRGEGPARLC